MLAAYIGDCSKMQFGLTYQQILEFAHSYALRFNHGINVTSSLFWQQNEQVTFVGIVTASGKAFPPCLNGASPGSIALTIP
ncbi:hypothetical protein ILUMI_16098 [Ignelater luminosus]|uniref:Uncharacterized protein n=1 Tax=Ignelater luminosus TaxID=2038154 RepID=A0A8K0CMG5_IGNLU|nr:hypothetical protein ILUMI_16098 [Ignelater luminosus]